MPTGPCRYHRMVSGSSTRKWIGWIVTSCWWRTFARAAEKPMGEYTLPHEFAGEQQRLALMSSLLDPVELAHIARLGVRPGWRCLELGCGNGSIARALAERVAPAGHVVASDIDLSCIA